MIRQGIVISDRSSLYREPFTLARHPEIAESATLWPRADLVPLCCGDERLAVIGKHRCSDFRCQRSCVALQILNVGTHTVLVIRTWVLRR